MTGFWITLSVVAAIIPTIIFWFFYITISNKTLKKESQHLVKQVYSETSEKASEVDKIFGWINHLLIIPAVIFIMKFPYLFGVPLILNGLYGLISGRIFTLNSIRGGFIRYHRGWKARYSGFIELVLGIVLSYLFGTTFPKFD